MAEPTLPAPLLAAIVAHPDDDAPRLVAADWFAEHGAAERADFIVRQCQLARLRPQTGEHAQLRAALGAAEKAHRKRWEPWARQVTLGFERGFPTSVLADADEVADLAPELVERAPLLTHLALSRIDRVDALRRLTRSALWPKIRTLTLWSPSEAAATELLGATPLGGLEALQVAEAELTDQTWAMLPSAGLTALRSLRLSKCNAAFWIRHGAALPHLRSLDLEWCNVRTADLEALLRTLAFGGLEELRLDWNHFGASGARVLSTARAGPLRALSLENCGLRAAGVVALARAPHLDLAALSLRGLTASGVAARRDATEADALAPLLDAPCLRHVQRLDVRGVAIGQRLREALAARFGDALLAD